MTSDRERSNEFSREAQRLVAHEDHVDMRIEFDWHFAGPAQLDAELAQLIVPEDLKGPGIYRIRSGRRNSGEEFDCWYVGRTMVDMDGRVTFHASEDFDEDERCLKRFKANLREDDGWVEVDRAVDISVNGISTLRMTPPSDRRADPGEWEVVELVFNLIEATGLASNLPYGGRASKK